MSTRILLGVKTAGKADNLPPSSTDVTESGSLNLPETSGPHRFVMGMFYEVETKFMLSAQISVT
jgi:hypothetical protein